MAGREGHWWQVERVNAERASAPAEDAQTAGVVPDRRERMQRDVVQLVVCSPCLPDTASRTEQVIARSKVRYKTVRGYKSVRGALVGVALTQWLYSGAPEHDLGELVA